MEFSEAHAEVEKDSDFVYFQKALVQVVRLISGENKR